MKMLLAITIITLIFYTSLFSKIIKRIHNSCSHKYLALSLFSLICWSGLSWFSYSAETLSSIRILMPVSMTGMFFYFPLNNLFVLSLGRKRKLHFFYPVLILIPALFLTIINFFIPVGFRDYILHPQGWEFVPNIGHPLNTFWLVYAVLMFIMVITHLVFLVIRSRFSFRRKRYAVLLAASGLSVIFSLSEYLFHDFLQQFWIVSISPILMSIWVWGMYYAIKKQKLLDIFPDETAGLILHTLDECILFTEADGTISYMNHPMETLFKKYDLNTYGEKIDTVFLVQNNPVIQNIQSVVTTAEASYKLVIRDVPITATDSVFDMKITKTRNKNGKSSGYIYKGTLHKAFGKVCSDYNLTKREIEVMKLVSVNLRNKAIGKKLNITERTVKAHLFNIYKKLNIKNKLELISFLFLYKTDSEKEEKNYGFAK